MSLGPYYNSCYVTKGRESLQGRTRELRFFPRRSQRCRVSQIAGLLLRSSTDTGFVLLSRCHHLTRQLVPEAAKFQPKTFRGQTTAEVAPVHGVARG